MIIAEARTQYKSRKWQVVNGHLIASYPPGPDGKRAAQRHALRIDRPDLSALVDHLAKDSHDNAKHINMAIKAAQIIDRELVHIDGDNIICISQSRPGVHHRLTYDGHPKTYGCNCSCEAYQYRSLYVTGIGWLCKHGLALHWLWLLDQPIPNYEIKF